MTRQDVVITGIGLVSSLGEGPDAHWQALSQPGATPVVDETAFAPFAVHPLPAMNLDAQIPKKGDQRQMEPWQRLGTYAAGLAIDQAGARGLVSDMHLIVAAGGGERDIAVDEAVASALCTTPADQAGPIAERTPGHRPAADPVPGAAVEPAGRQYLDRAWRHGLLAHLHGRGSGGGGCRAHRRGAAGRRARRHRAGGRRLCVAALGPAAAVWRRRGGCGAGPSRRSRRAMARAASSAARSAPSWCWRRRTHAAARGAAPLARIGGIATDTTHVRAGGASATDRARAVGPAEARGRGAARRAVGHDRRGRTAGRGGRLPRRAGRCGGAAHRLAARPWRGGELPGQCRARRAGAVARRLLPGHGPGGCRATARSIASWSPASASGAGKRWPCLERAA